MAERVNRRAGDGVTPAEEVCGEEASLSPPMNVSRRAPVQHITNKISYEARLHLFL
jgi:hypothetical protein